MIAFTVHHSILNFQFFTSFGKFGASLHAKIIKTVVEPLKHSLSEKLSDRSLKNNSQNRSI